MGTTAQKLQAILDSKSAIKDAIESKGVTVGDAPLDEYASKIGEIPAPMEEAPENDVNFYDYDGFRVASYTIAEAKALTALPTPPTHEGLTFQEWNWTLADIQSYNRQYIDIGANYIPTDGKTHIKALADCLDVAIYTSGLKGTISIDWGDGSTEDSYSYPSYKYNKPFTHTYSALGYKNIKIGFTQSDTGGCYGLSSTNNGSAFAGLRFSEILVGNYYEAKDVGVLTNINRSDVIISIPKNILLSGTAFSQSLYKQITIPRDSNYEFGYQNFACMPNTKICMPKTIKSFGASNYAYYQSIFDRIVVPDYTDSVTISSGAFDSFFASMVSLPLCAEFATKSNGQYLASPRLTYVDIAQGWIPNQDMNFSNSTMWSADYMVKFFTNLGTTSTTRTLTFGSTNLGKLTNEQKAIATNKGYTLA